MNITLNNFTSFASTKLVPNYSYVLPSNLYYLELTFHNIASTAQTQRESTIKFNMDKVDLLKLSDMLKELAKTIN